MSSTSQHSAEIFVVATPIGNLDDLSVRALEVLKSADVIACEDTRRTKQLLNHFRISGVKLIAYHDHVEEKVAPMLIERLIASGERLVLVSDAGTPCIADPGYRLIARAHEAQIKVHPIPGPTAAMSALSVSGLPSDQCLFVGFLPTKASAAEKEIAAWRHRCPTIVFYESARRVKASFERIVAVYPAASFLVARELTKVHEECVRLEADQVLAWCKAHPALKGEVAVVVHLGEQEASDLDQGTLEAEMTTQLKKGASLKDLLGTYRDCGLSRQQLYAKILELKSQL